MLKSKSTSIIIPRPQRRSSSPHGRADFRKMRTLGELYKVLRRFRLLRRQSLPGNARFAISFLAVMPLRAAAGVIFVNAAATGLNDGTSWTDARTSLQDALNQARAGDVIWVAEGTYRPGDSRADTFQLPEGVGIFGGLAGVEDPAGFDLNARDLSAHATILDGEIGSPGAADNVFHVLTTVGVSRASVLDGFTITRGDANGVTLTRQDVGAGLLNLDASPTIRNCLFMDNQAGTRGGAVHVDGGAPLFINCRFFNNRTTVTQAANNVGGAIYANAATGRTAQAQFINCLFVGNRAGVGSGGSGGALYDDLQSVSTMVNCTLLHNFADTHGGGVFGSPVLTNCILRGNRDRDGVGRASQIRGSAVVTYSCVQGGWAGIGNVADDPLLRDELGPDGIAGTSDDDAHLSPGSPCIDAGNNDALTAAPGASGRDLDGNPRFIDDPVMPDTGRPPGSSIVDMGAFEYQASCVVAADCDDGLFCDGVESCVGGRCTPGVGPLCDDGVACTRDSCRESDHACVHNPDDALCDDGVFCNGQEVCDGIAGCTAGNPVSCDDGVACTVDHCDEVARSCAHVADHGACDDGVFCNGVEVCDPLRGCLPGTPVNCDDGVPCTLDSCDEDTKSCLHLADQSACNDGLFCNGVEVCDPLRGCLPGTPVNCDDGVPCMVDSCDEASRACVHDLDHAQCDDGLFCNGSETCTPTGCAAGAPPCADASLCDENADTCLSSPPTCIVAADCDDGNPCTDDACVDGACLRVNNASPCDDRNSCTGNDVCAGGVCSGIPIAGCGVSPPGPTIVPDSDGDGVPDTSDRCPGTRPGAIVDANGCSCDQLDDDGDGVNNCLDGCLQDKNKSAPGKCGCGKSDVDSDADGSPDCIDRCPHDAKKTAPGICGCGVPDRDSDGDGTPDCLDRCPSDRHKTAPGRCGCGIADNDHDSDGTPDCLDGCPDDPAKIEPGGCGCGLPDTDSDGDGVLDCNDLCPGSARGVAVTATGCPMEPEPTAPLPDSDGDGVADDADVCPNTPQGQSVDALGCAPGESGAIGDSPGATLGRRSCGACGALGAMGIWFWPVAVISMFWRLGRRQGRDRIESTRREGMTS